MPEDGSYNTASELAALLQLPGPFLSKVLKVLARNGVLQSHRGPRGGFRLARPAHCVTVKDILDAIEGVVTLPGCQMGSDRWNCRDNPCVLHQALEDLKAYMDIVLFQVTIRDLQVQHIRHMREQAAAHGQPGPQ
jgi:Rrf2 family protein